ncbi:MAG: bifunctional methylenetetrahydrofolate dehydrogenase/methenyltetrahydrofolate cyclohydrolase FolD [Bacteroidales bacterium]|nr:bifunctional methylenetetrahydrofolate dehydrogenase/methenyltetrahydrofolate cyclohydrolase FolD [Bacteroidales bacterium]
MQLIDGKSTANKIKEELKEEVAAIVDNDQRAPHLVAVLVGDDPASETYVGSKEKNAKKLGFTSSVYRLDADTTEEELLKTVDFLNNDPEVDGFIVQLPLPEHINADKVTQAIDPKKDVDGFHPVNLGRMMIGLPAYLPATPNGIMELLKRYDIETEGKHCVVLGRSNIVGTPMNILMSRKTKPGNATVTMCHSRTQNLKGIVKSADIIIAAIGKKEFVTADMVKEGAVVIDVGIHREKSDKTKSGWKLKGDVAFDEVSKKASYISPVPGGVGPMTIVSLLMNTLKAYKKEVYTD